MSLGMAFGVVFQAYSVGVYIFNHTRSMLDHHSRQKVDWWYLINNGSFRDPGLSRSP